jgi:membrane dipeptidase
MRDVAYATSVAATTDSAQLHRDAVVVDTHNDLALTLAMRGIGDRGTLRGRWIPQLREGGVDVQVCPVYTAPTIPEAQLRETLRQIAFLKKEAGENPDDVQLCLTGAEIDTAVADGKIALVLAMEGAAAIGFDEVLVELFYELGVRMVSYTHMGRTALADGSGEDATGSRLTRAGVAVFHELERLGVVFDVSHLGAAGVEHVLELATRPLIASHSAARALQDHHRNLTDDQLRAIAATGGVVGINLLACFIDPARPTIDRIVDHYEHMVGVIGIEHVGVGPDFISDIYDDLYPTHLNLSMEGLDSRLNVPDLYSTYHLPNLTAAFLARGWSESDVRLVLGENFLRVFRQVIGIPQGA